MMKIFQNIYNNNKVLLVLFAIVLLCSAKLLKDYLKRNHILEGAGLSVTPDASLTQPPSGSVSKTSNLTFNLTLNNPIESGGKLVVTWNNSEITAASCTPLTVTNFNDGIGVDPSNKLAKAAFIVAGTGEIKSLTYTASGSTNRALSLKIDLTINATPTLNNVKTIAFKIDAHTNAVATNPSDSKTVSVAILPSTSVSNQYVTTGGTSLATAGGATSSLSTMTAGTDVYNAIVDLAVSTYNSINGASQVFSDQSLYDAQGTAMTFIENERARAKRNAEILESDNNNKKRMSQINVYYTQNYQANIDIMKNVIYMSVFVIILSILKKRELIPSAISTLGTILILVFGSISIGKKIFDILRRNDFEFDKYDWNFDPDNVDTSKMVKSSENGLTDLSMIGAFGAPCYGPGCCESNTAWDDTLKKCIMPNCGADNEWGLYPTPGQCYPSANNKVTPGTASWTAPVSGTSLGNITVGLTTKTALGANTDKILIQLPPNTFTISGTLAVTGVNGTVAYDSTTNLITITVTADVAAAAALTIILSAGTFATPTGSITPVPAATRNTKPTIKVYTSKDPIPAVISTITSLP